MERRTLLKTIGATAGAATLGAPAAADDSHGERNGKGKGHGHGSGRRDELGYDLVGVGEHDLLTNEELGDLLEEIETDEDEVSVKVIGESNEGRDIYAASVGTGGTNVLALGEQHGHEPFNAEGCVATLEYLASSNHRAIQDVTEAVTLHIVPRVNPDGLARRQRVNHDPDAPENDPDEGFYTREGGWDPNRYHWYDWEESTLYENHPEEYPENPVPELRALMDHVSEVDPEWVVDYHRQGPHVDSDGDLIDLSMAWPQNPDVPEDAQELSQQLAGLFYEEVPDEVESNITEFTPAGEYAGIGRNAHGLAGRGSVLYEISTATRGGIGYRIQLVAESLLLAVEATADGSLYNVDPDTVDEIPEEWGTTMNL